MRTNQAGFTLAELLIALAILGLLAVFWAGSLQFGVQAWSQANSGVIARDEVMRTQDVLRRVLRNAIPPASPRDRFGDARYRMTGEASRLEFATTLPDGIGSHASVRVVLALEPGGDAKDLVMTIAGTALAAEQDAVEAPDRIVLLRGVRDALFEYRGLGASEWSSSWSDGVHLPALISLTMTFADSDVVREWPDFWVQPKLNAPPLCYYDPVSRGCASVAQR